MTLPQPTTEAAKEHFRETNPRCWVRNLQDTDSWKAAIWVYPPYHMYDEGFRQYMHEMGLKWSKENDRWELPAPANQQDLVQQIIARAFDCGWDVETDANTPGFQPQWTSLNQGEMYVATSDSLWYEHPEDYDASGKRY